MPDAADRSWTRTRRGPRRPRELQWTAVSPYPAVDVFADGADLDSIDVCYEPADPGFTTNPTLLRKAGVTDYEGFARDCSRSFPTADLLRGVRRRGRRDRAPGPQDRRLGPQRLREAADHHDTGIARLRSPRTWPVTGVKLNVTALMTAEQVAESPALADGPDCSSRFSPAGRRHRPRPDPDHARVARGLAPDSNCG